jgi:hypothetical protein
MERTYKQVELESGYSYIEMKDTEGNVYSIPLDPANNDYQAYLASISEGSKTTTEEGDK